MSKKNEPRQNVNVLAATYYSYIELPKMLADIAGIRKERPELTDRDFHFEIETDDHDSASVLRLYYSREENDDEYTSRINRQEKSAREQERQERYMYDQLKKKYGKEGKKK